MKLSSTFCLALIIIGIVSVNAYGYQSILRYLGMGYGPGYHSGGRYQSPIESYQPEQVYPNHSQNRRGSPAPQAILPAPDTASVNQPEAPIYSQPQNQSPANYTNSRNPRIERLPPIR